MKLILYILFIFPMMLNGQNCIDTIFVIYEPFQAKLRVPSTIEEFEIRRVTDTIYNPAQINELLDLLQNTFENSDKVFIQYLFPKILVIMKFKGRELQRFYITGARKLYVHGYYYTDSKALLDKLLNFISSDDRFIEELEELNRRFKKQ